jgi:hypothetical protein
MVPGALSLAVKWQGNEAVYSPPSCAEVKNDEATLPLPCLHGLVLNIVPYGYFKNKFY